jgi:hypothetical protein
VPNLLLNYGSESNYPNRYKIAYKKIKANNTFALKRTSKQHVPVWYSFEKVILGLLLTIVVISVDHSNLKVQLIVDQGSYF